METTSLERICREIRLKILEICAHAEGGHVASSLSCVEMLVALYHGNLLRHDPKNPKWEGRDYFILSKGHAAPALYPVLADLGYFDKGELDNFCAPHHMLGCHVDDAVPGIELTTGSLGYGLGVGAGMALGLKKNMKSNMVFTLMGDGECYEGSVWEAAMFAGHHHLNNLVAIIDRNHACVLDFTENLLRLEPLVDKWGAFGWNVVSIDGHSIPQIIKVFSEIRCRKTRQPTLIISNTIKGKGAPVLEYNPMAHITIPKGKDLEEARRGLSE